MSSWPLTSPSKPDRIQAADEVRSSAERRGQKVGRALLRCHAALREGDELNVDPVPVGLAHAQHGFEIGEADVVVDVDVAARPRRAVGDQCSDERRGARLDRQRDAMAFDALGGDPLAHAVSLDMGQTRRAPMRLVQMDVAVDERRQEERALKIDALARLISACRRVQRRNDAAGDFDIGEAALGETRVGQDHQTRLRRFAAAY